MEIIEVEKGIRYPCGLPNALSIPQVAAAVKKDF